jgi:alpha-N-arabinofuranosidase
MGDLGCGCRPKKHFDAVSFHYYTGHSDRHKGSATQFGADDYWDSLASAWRVDELLTRHSNVMDAYDPTGRIGLVLDEWGTWWDVEPGTNPRFLFQQNALRDALIASLHFDSFHRHANRLVMANIAQTINVLQAMILTIDDVMVKTPTYHVFEMNKGHHDATLVDLAWTTEIPTHEWNGHTVPTVSASATTKDGRVLVSLTNLDPDADVTLSFQLRGGDVALDGARILTADSLQSHNTATALDAVAPQNFDGARLTDGLLEVSLPAHSFATVSLTVS